LKEIFKLAKIDIGRLFFRGTGLALEMMSSVRGFHRIQLEYSHDLLTTNLVEAIQAKYSKQFPRFHFPTLRTPYLSKVAEELLALSVALCYFIVSFVDLVFLCSHALP